MNIIEKAARIAVEAHDGQKRKNDGSPYIVHPFMVALKVAQHGFKEDIIAAALLHDVLEDTGIPEERLRQELGSNVVGIVKNVTYKEGLKWKAKRKDYNKRVAQGSEGTKAISIADKIHNLTNLLESYEELGPSLWDKFNRGREDKLWSEEDLLKGLKEVWEHPLLDEYEKLVEKMRNLV
jgi:guanosine-3',5'-bis(diphosphate) 3'-pyrophosphohydrolase